MLQVFYQGQKGDAICLWGNCQGVTLYDAHFAQDDECNIPGTPAKETNIMPVAIECKPTHIRIPMSHGTKHVGDPGEHVEVTHDINKQ